jgi:pre-mRNA-splicing factor 38A
MANRTDPEAGTVHGTNPQNLVEKIVRTKIYECTYWKAHCFALNAETIIDRAVELRCVGGTYGGTRKPTDFICLVLKMLQIQPEKEIIREFIFNEDYKYLRLLGAACCKPTAPNATTDPAAAAAGAFYLRLTGKGPEVYSYLEPLYGDYRKVRMMTAEGNYVLTHVDELVDMMLHQDHMFDTTMPFIPSRLVAALPLQATCKQNVPPRYASHELPPHGEGAPRGHRLSPVGSSTAQRHCRCMPLKRPLARSPCLT